MRCQDTQMSELAELSAMASVVEDVKNRVVAMAEANVVPEEILRDLSTKPNGIWPTHCGA